MATGRSSSIMDSKPEDDDTRSPTQTIENVPETEKMAWDQDTVNNPRLWNKKKKWTMVAIVSMYTFITPLASSMMAPGLPDIAEEFNITSSTVVALSLSIFLLAFALGPLVLGPLSEVYGRTWILHFSNLFFLCFNLGCALVTNTTGLIVCRFLSGLGGSAPVAIGGGSIGDLFHERERAAAMAIYTMGPLLGPVVGPIAGGFIVQTIGFKWVFRLITILSGVCAVIGIPLLRETYAPVIIQRLEAKGDIEKGEAPRTDKPNVGRVLWISLTRPVILLTRSMICFVLSAYMALIYGLLYLLFTTFPTLFQDTYGWNAGVSGLSYLGIGIGFFGASVVGATTMNTLYLKLTEKNNGVAKPEFRIPSAIIGAIFVPIGLLWYGWSADRRLHFIMPIIGSGIFGCGMMLTFLPLQLYLIDSFQFAASAMAAAAVLRSLFGFAFPLFGDQMFDGLGVGPGYSMLAGISVLLGIPFPIWLYLRGEQMRQRNALTRK